MKKRLATYKLNRNTQQRTALFKSLLQSLVLREGVTTTAAKAKAVRPLFERLITTAKGASISARRQIQAVLQSPALTKKIMSEIAPRYQNTHGGYTSVTPVGNRQGDNAAMVKLMLTKRTVSAKPIESKAEAKAEVVEAPKPVSAPTVAQPAKVAPTKAAPKLVRRTGRRGDK